MKQSISIKSLQKLVEKKANKKMFLRLMWNETEKITLFTKPNMKVNAFIYDEKDGYLFFDEKRKMINETIPCVIPEKYIIDGKISLQALKSGDILIQGEPLTKEDLSTLE